MFHQCDLKEHWTDTLSVIQAGWNMPHPFVEVCLLSFLPRVFKLLSSVFFEDEDIQYSHHSRLWAWLMGYVAHTIWSTHHLPTPWHRSKDLTAHQVLWPVSLCIKVSITHRVWAPDRLSDESLRMLKLLCPVPGSKETIKPGSHSRPQETSTQGSQVPCWQEFFRTKHFNDFTSHRISCRKE